MASFLDRSNLDRIRKDIEKAKSLSDLLPFLYLCKEILDKVLTVEVYEDWAKEALQDLLGDIAKNILSIRNRF